MNKEELIEYLKHRIECVQAFLRDMYAVNTDDIEVVRAETQLELLLEILHEIKN